MDGLQTAQFGTPQGRHCFEADTKTEGGGQYSQVAFAVSVKLALQSTQVDDELAQVVQLATRHFVQTPLGARKLSDMLAQSTQLPVSSKLNGEEHRLHCGRPVDALSAQTWQFGGQARQ